MLCRYIHFLFHFSCSANESENLFDAEVYLQPPNDAAQADFRIGFGTHITTLEAERDDVENVNDLQEEAHSENEDNLAKEEDFKNDLENKRSDLFKWSSK